MESYRRVAPQHNWIAPQVLHAGWCEWSEAATGIAAV